MSISSTGQFFGATIFLFALSTAMTVVIMKLHFSGEHGNHVPRWLRKLVLVYLARVVRMNKTASATVKVRHASVLLSLVEMIVFKETQSSTCIFIIPHH